MLRLIFCRNPESAAGDTWNAGSKVTSVGVQVLDILARLSIAERASIDECYLDITQEASKRLSACSGHPPLPSHAEQVHVCGEVSHLFGLPCSVIIRRKRHLLASRPSYCLLVLILMQRHSCSACTAFSAPPQLYSCLFRNYHFSSVIWRSQGTVKVSAGACIGSVLQEDRGGAAGWWRRPAEAWGPGQRLLACGAQVIAELRAAVREELGYSCSAGAPLWVLALDCGGPAASNLAGGHVERYILIGTPSQHALIAMVV